MNLFDHRNSAIIEHKSSLRKAKRLYRKNRLHESISVLQELKHHGYNSDEINLLLARAYDRLAFLTSDAEYEDAAMDKYDDVIKYSGKRRYKKKAVRLRNSLSRRITSLNESERRACDKALEMSSRLPKSPKAWFMLAANFSVRKDPYFVINAYKNAVRLNENYILALYRIGYLYRHYIQDSETALQYFLRLIKIPPYEDTIEPEVVNIRAILDACNELSDIYIENNSLKKVISVFDHAMNIYRTYNDICAPHDIKKTVKNTYSAVLELDKLPALKKHVLNRYNMDMDILFDELGIG